MMLVFVEYSLEAGIIVAHSNTLKPNENENDEEKIRCNQT